MKFGIPFLVFLISQFFWITPPPNEELIKCELIDFMNPEFESNEKNIAESFNNLIGEDEYIISKGYLVKFSIVLRKENIENQYFLKFHNIRMSDLRNSLTNKDNVKSNIKDQFLKVLPKYLAIIDKEKMYKSCEYITFKLQLRSCN